MSTAPLHIFFIASWLPSRHDAFEGDFILRHAQAIATMHKVSVAYVIESDIAQNTHEIWETEEQGNIIIHRIYIHPKYNSVFKKQRYYQTIEKLFLHCNQQNKVDIIHANIHWRAGYAAYRLFKKYQTPYVISEHSGYFNTEYYKQHTVNNYSFLKKYYVRQSLVHANMCMPVSAYLATWMKKFDAKIKTTVVSNVVDTSQFYFEKINTDSPFIFLHASMNWPEKNVLKIVEAAKLLAEENNNFQLHLHIPFSSSIHHYINQYHLENIVLQKGLVPHTHMPSVIQAANATILYSDMETQGCIVIESLCCGRPMIVSNAPVFPEMVNDTNGLICGSTASNDLKNAMFQMMQNYSIFQQELLAAEAASKYGFEAIAKLFSNVYSNVLQLRNLDA